MKRKTRAVEEFSNNIKSCLYLGSKLVIFKSLCGILGIFFFLLENVVYLELVQTIDRSQFIYSKFFFFFFIEIVNNELHYSICSTKFHGLKCLDHIFIHNLTTIRYMISYE